MKSKEEAKRRIQKALKKIEQAQWMMDDAAQDISRVVGVMKEWEYLVSLYEKIKGSWYKLDAKQSSSQIDLDSEERCKPEYQS